jgi:beta-barrel assembly-enhancing protease
VSTTVLPMSDETAPSHPTADERVLWTLAEKEEAKLAATGKILGDPPLDEYLRRIAESVVPTGARASGTLAIRVIVLRDPTLNAFAMPDGTVYVHTGLLARLENEAQLAFILAHELVHVTERHALTLERERRATWGGGAGAGDSPGRHDGGLAASALAGPGLDLALAAAVNGFGRTLEGEADTEALARMVQAGYDPGEAPRALTLLLAGHGDPSAPGPFLLGRRAEIEERIRATQDLLATRYAGAGRSELVRKAAPFLCETRIAVRENAALDIRAGRFRWGAEQLDRVLALARNDRVALVYYGDLYRLHAQRAPDSPDAPTLLARARERYEQAAAADPAYPVPFRQLGLLYYQEREISKASEAFKKYLALEPDAADARRIKEYVNELDR